ncbi:hypothetical protein BH10BAC6_BH10BAC6_07270 [soil metagenome]
MMDFLTQNPTYVVLATALIIWVGIAWYLTRIERRLRSLEQSIGSKR